MGLSEEGLVGDVLGQGIIGSSYASQALLNDGVSDEFDPGGPDEPTYRTIIFILFGTF